MANHHSEAPAPPINVGGDAHLIEPSGLSSPAAGNTTTVPSSASAANPLNHKVTVAFGRCVEDTTLTVEEMTLAELSELFKKPDTSRGTLSASEYHALRKEDPAQKARRQREKNGQYFCAANFKVGGKRDDDHVESVWAVVLDFDTGRTTESLIRERVKEWFFTAYTSYSHRPSDERWRVVIPYAEPVSAEQHKLVFDHFNALFDDDLDKRGRVPSQAWYTPACPRDAASDFKAFLNPEPLFDASAVRAATPSESKTDSYNPTPEKKPVSVNIARLTSALEAVSSDDRDIWIKVGLALKGELGEAGLPIWQKWSAKSSKFDRDECMKAWESFKPREGKETVTVATIFYLAEQAGWSYVPNWVTKLNDEYFLAPLGRHFEIFWEYRDPITGHWLVTPMDKGDFLLKFENQTIPVQRPNGAVTSLNVGKAWLQHSGRREYEGVILAPEINDTRFYNKWRGFAVEPKQGSWGLMREHIRSIICSGDQRLDEYVLGWMASCVQNPGKRLDVALILRGGRGTGKSKFANALGKLFGQHFLQITQSRHLVGNFNSHLADCLLVFADEALWAGDKQGESVLKAIITEPTIAVERKRFDVENAPNRLNIIMASNSDWVVPAGLDERRFCVLEVSDLKQQDRGYFSALLTELESGGYEAMLYDLLRIDLKDFDPGVAPLTQALDEQKILSLSPIQRWWLDKLKLGYFIEQKEEPDQTPIGKEELHPWEIVPKQVIHDDYVAALKKLGTPRRSTETELGMALRKLLPKGFPESPRPTGNDPRLARRPHYRLPPLEACRKHFEKVAKFHDFKW